MASNLDPVNASPSIPSPAAAPVPAVPPTALSTTPSAHVYAGDMALDDPLTVGQSDDISGFSEPQQQALSALARGQGPVQAALAAGVSRMTIHRWQHHDEKFAAAVNLFRRQRRDALAAGLSSMQEKVLSVLSALLDKGDFRAVKLVASLLAQERIGPTTPAGFARRRAHGHARAAGTAVAQLVKMGRAPLDICKLLEQDFFKHAGELKKLESRLGETP